MRTYIKIILLTVCLMILMYNIKSFNIESFDTEPIDISNNIEIENIENNKQLYDYIYNKLYNGDEWNNYRIGDVYYKYSPQLYDINYEHNILYHKYKYTNSIANIYINNNIVENTTNKTLIKSIIEKKIIDKNLYSNILFIHIRVGDIFCDIENISENKITDYSKKNNIEWWNNIISYINNNNITKVTIISGIHRNVCLEQSTNYIVDSTLFLIKNKPELKIDYRLGQNPDNDIITCYYIKHFISTGGGFGQLINDVKVKY